MTYSPFAPTSLHSLTTSVEINGITLPICITYEYDPGEPGYGPSWYDAGQPGSPPSAEIIGVRVRLDDGWMDASDRVWSVVDGDVDIYEQMMDAALEDISAHDMAAREFQMEFRNG